MARPQNNGDNKPFSEKRCIIIIFPRMNYLFTEDIWERTVYDRDRKMLLVRIIERFFCFRPLEFATQKKHLLKTVDHTPKHITMELHCLYCHFFSPADSPTPDEFSHHHHDTCDTPILFRCETVHK